MNPRHLITVSTTSPKPLIKAIFIHSRSRELVLQEWRLSPYYSNWKLPQAYILACHEYTVNRTKRSVKISLRTEDPFTWHTKWGHLSSYYMQFVYDFIYFRLISFINSMSICQLYERNLNRFKIQVLKWIILDVKDKDKWYQSTHWRSMAIWQSYHYVDF